MSQEKMNKAPGTPMAALMRGTPPPATPPKRPTPEPDQRSPTGVGEMLDEDDATDAMFTCVDDPTRPPPSITRKDFTGDPRALIAQVGLVINAFGLGGLADMDVSEEEAMHNALRDMVSRNAHTLSPNSMGVTKRVARNLNMHSDPDDAPAIFKAARFVMNVAQRDALAQVTDIAHASPDIPAVKAVMQSLETPDALMDAGVPEEPVRKLTGDLNRHITKRQSPDADLLQGGLFFLELTPPMAPGECTSGFFLG